MPTTPPQLIAQATRHAAHLERLKSGYVKDLLPLLDNMQRNIIGRLASQDITAWTTRRLTKQLTAIGGLMETAYQGDIKDKWREQLLELSDYESGFEARSLNEIAVNYDFDLPSETQLKSAVFTEPLHVAGPDGGKLLESFYADWTDNQIKKTTGIIRLGFAQGKTTSQVVRDIRDFGGLADQSRRSLEAVARTSLQHAANQARQQTWAANSDIIKKVRWVSTLDTVTSTQCQSLDSTEYPIDSGPRPPIHPNACLSGSLISTARGDIPVEFVKVGDYVKTHTGSWRRVYTVMARHHDGLARTLINNFGCRVRLTNEHPILTKNKGWIEAGSVEVGDIFFHDPQNLAGLLNAATPLVPQRVLTDAHNIVTGLTQELVSYGIFSSTAGVSSAVNLNQSVADNEVGVIGKNSIVSSVINTNGVKDASEKLLVRSAFDDECCGHGVPNFFQCHPVLRWVVGCHSCGRLFRHLSMSFWSLATPVIIPSRMLDILLGITDRIRLTFNFDPVSFASGIQGACPKPYLFLNKPYALPGSEMLFLDKGLNKNLIHDNSSTWIAATCSGIEEYHYSGMVYNLAVSGDETYTADGFVVHNCRSTTVAVLDDRFKVLEEGATRRERDPVTGKVGSAPAKQTYYSWLKGQPQDVQESIIGKTRAKLLTDGGLSSERFAELQLGKNFEPLKTITRGGKTITPIEKMRELEPVAFSRAGLN